MDNLLRILVVRRLGAIYESRWVLKRVSI